MKLKRLTAENLSPAEKTTLLEQCREIFLETSDGTVLENFEAYLFPSPKTRLALFYSVDGKLVGYTNATVSIRKYEGSDHAVYTAGVYFRQGYPGGAHAAYFGLTETLLFKLRNPFMPVAYLTRASHPASYRILASAAGRLYPSFRYPTPSEVEALSQEISVSYGTIPLKDRPWLVENKVWAKNPGRLFESPALNGDPHVLFYLKMNPKFLEEKVALLVWVPLDLRNVFQSLIRLALGKGSPKRKLLA